MDVFHSSVSLEAAEKKNAVFIDLKNVELPIVDIAKPAEEAVPDQAAAQALYNSKVQEETTAAGHPSPHPFHSAVDAAPRGARASTKQPLPSSGTSLPQQGERGLESPTGSKFSNSMQDELAALQHDQKLKEQRSLQRFDSTKNVVLPTNFDDTGGSPDDFIPEYKVGGRTYVNALANPLIAYYVELKRKFKLTWNPIPPLRNQLTSTSRGQVQVVWGLTVDAAGQVTDVELIQGSGLSQYDAEARRTMQVSAPFSRPPLTLLTPDQHVYMAWTFVVYLKWIHLESH